MQQFIKRRFLGVLAAAITTQMLSACVVVPVPAYRSGAVIVHPGYGYGYPATPYRDPYWRR